MNFTEHIILPVSDFLTGKSIAKHLRFLEKSQFWSRDKIEAYQNEKLKALIAHTYHNVPFYRGIFEDLRLKPEDIQTKNDLEKLPVITKDDIRKNYDKWMAVNIPKSQLISYVSSGSTGEPFLYYRTKYSESFQKATAIRAWKWMNYRMGNKYVKTSIHERESTLKKIQDIINRSLFLNFSHFNDAFFKKTYAKILNFEPVVIRGYPHPLSLLASYIQRNHKSYSGKKLKAINTTGSTLHPKDRQQLENTFKVKVFDSYSCEGSAFIAQCEHNNLYHPAEEYAILEFLPSKYTETDPEKPLRHITTDLHNYAFPFIRYDTQDYVVVKKNIPCDCNRKLLSIAKIKGRDTDILITPQKKYILMENILGYFENQQNVLQIQVVQEDYDTFVFNLVVNSSFNNQHKEIISTYWQNFMGDDCRIIINMVDEIQLTRTGKRRTVIRNTKIKINY